MNYPRLAQRLAVLMAGLTPAIHAAEISKADNLDNLSTAGSWVGGIVPGSSDIAVFDGAVLSAGAIASMDASLALRGIKGVGAISGVSFDTFGSGLGAAGILTLGTSGLDFSSVSAGSSFLFDSPTIRLSAAGSQTWTIADGVSVNVMGPINATGATLRLNLGANGTGVLTATGFPSPTAFIPYATLETNGQVNFATTDLSTLNIIPATGLADANPSDGGNATVNAELTAAPASGRFVDVVNSNGLASATAFRVQRVGTGAGVFFNNAGIRFNQPHATEGTDWVVDMSQRILYPDRNTTTILVTPGVGDRDVIFNGGNNGNAFRYNNSGAQLIINQLNTQGDVIIRATSSARLTGNNFTKGGPGRLIMGNAGHHSAGGSTVYLAEGVTQLGENNATGTFGTLPIVVGGTLRFQRSDTHTASNLISGTGDVEVAMSGTGNLTLSGANTFTGTVKLESGTLTLGSAGALGANSGVELVSGSLVYGAGVSTDITSSGSMAVNGAVTINTNGNDVSFANGIAGSGSITKTGLGTLQLNKESTYLGTTTINAGALRVNNSTGSATGAGAVTLANGTTLSGAGTIAGAVTAPTGAKIIPGVSGVGTLNVGGLTLAAGSLLELDFSSTTNHDKIVVSSGSLTVNGGGVTLLSASDGLAWKTPGTYNLVQYAGTIQGTGPSALSVLNPQAGYSYTFGSASGMLNLQIVQDAILTKWTTLGDGTWASAGNWSNGIPASGYTAEFTTAQTAPITVSLNGNRTVNGVVFSSPNGYTIASGTNGVLTVDKGANSAAINVLDGHHVISAPVALSSHLAVSTAADSSLTMSGAVSGSRGIVKASPGLLDLTGHNTFTGDVTLAGGTIGFTHADSLGAGALILDGGTLRYNSGTTNDISSRAITIQAGGGVIDTNGNNVIFAAPIGNGGPGALTKTGNGMLTLASGNTFGGGLSVTGGALHLIGANPLGGHTTVGNGTLIIDENASLGDGTSDLNFNPGAGNDGRLQLNGADIVLGADRTIALGSGRAVLDTGSNQLTVSSALSGTGQLVKQGSGTLVLTTDALAGTTGTTVLDAGTITATRPAALPNGGNGIVLNGGTINFTTNQGYAVTNLTINGTNTILSGSTGGGTFGIGIINGGSGTLTTGSTNWVTDFTGSWNTFDGTIVLGGPNGGFRFNGNTGSASVTLDLGIRGISVRSGATGITLGALLGQAGSVLTGSGGGVTQNVVYTVGGKNLSTTFAGSITNGAGTTGITKTGTGTLTLTGISTHTGPTTVNTGTLRIDGAFDLNTTLGTASVVTVAADGTLAGSGAIAGAVTVDGTLRPGNTGGTLDLASTLTLNATATTRFELDGTVFTGITATGAVAYNGTLAVNQPGTAYNGTYPLFTLSGGESGDFGSVTVTNAGATDGVLTNNGSGVWTGTVGGITYSFSEATGALTVTGGATAVLPSVPTALQAVAGNAQVALTWNAAADASAYLIKRSTTAGGPYTTVATNAATTYTDLAVTNDTTYYYVVQARSVSGNVSADSAEVSATPSAPTVTYTALQEWRFAQFGVYDDTAEVLAGDTEDFDGDGLANLLEYAVNTNPTVPNASPVVIARSGSVLTLSYPVNADPALTYAVQGSSDLATGFTAGAGTTQTNAGVATYTDNVTLGSGIRRFLRLLVGYNSGQ